MRVHDTANYNFGGGCTGVENNSVFPSAGVDINGNDLTMWVSYTSS
jgi:hypothetical protein